MADTTTYEELYFGRMELRCLWSHYRKEVYSIRNISYICERKREQEAYCSEMHLMHSKWDEHLNRMDQLETEIFEMMKQLRAEVPEESLNEYEEFLNKPEEEVDDLTCAVCLQGFTGKLFFVTTGCQHTFHQTCMLTWAKTSSTCPLCRSGIEV